MATQALMTVDQFVRMETAETESFELVDGELVPLPSATLLHNNIRGRLEQLVRNYFDRNPIGGAASETDCRIGEDTVRKPDLGIFLAERWFQLDPRRIPLPLPPDIAVEIVSPSEHVLELNRKERDYLGAGSSEVWLIDPENREVRVRTAPGVRVLQIEDSLESPLLPGFSITVEKLLAWR